MLKFLFKNINSLTKNTQSYSIDCDNLFLSLPVRIIPARTWRAVTPGRGAAVRACVRARCHLFAPEEGTVTSRLDRRQRSPGNRPAVSQSGFSIKAERCGSGVGHGPSADPVLVCLVHRERHVNTPLCWAQELHRTPWYRPNRTRSLGSRRERVLWGNFTRRFNLTNVSCSS